MLLQTGHILGTIPNWKNKFLIFSLISLDEVLVYPWF